MEELNIFSLKKGKSTVKIDIPPEKLDIQDAVKKRVKGELVIEKRGNIIEIQGVIHYTLRLTCARCLEEFDKNVDEKIHLLLRKGKERILKEKELTDEDIDTVYIMGDAFDLSPEIRDMILLSIPIKPLCKEDCKGLCPVCGKNLNKGPCEHVKKQIIAKEHPLYVLPLSGRLREDEKKEVIDAGPKKKVITYKGKEKKNTLEN